MKKAPCKITEIKDKLLEHVETKIYKPAPKWLLQQLEGLSSIWSLVGSDIYIPVNIKIKMAWCKITEIKDEILGHVETAIHKPTLGNKLMDIFSSLFCNFVSAKASEFTGKQ